MYACVHVWAISDMQECTCIIVCGLIPFQGGAAASRTYLLFCFKCICVDSLSVVEDHVVLEGLAAAEGGGGWEWEWG